MPASLPTPSSYAPQVPSTKAWLLLLSLLAVLLTLGHQIQSHTIKLPLQAAVPAPRTANSPRRLALARPDAAPNPAARGELASTATL